MKNLIRIFLEGTITNIKRILFASDRVTDMELRSKILEGRIVPTEKVAEVSCKAVVDVPMLVQHRQSKW